MKTLQTNVNETLRNLLTQGDTVSIHEQSITDIESFMYQRLTSKKFRKIKMDDACVARTKSAIHLRVSQNKSLKVVYPQGGYKLWRFPSSPEADWAEFFNIAYMTEYLLPLARNYQPGVELVYYMHTLLMELHDNLTTAEIQEYVDSFQRLIDEFQKHLPKNFTISILRDVDIYERAEYFQKLEEGKGKAAKKYASWPDAKKQDFIRMAELNIKWKGKQDWTNLSEKERQQKLYDAALYEMTASSSLERVMEQVKAPDNVLVFTKATKEFIGIGSTGTSMAKYWVGFGVLETSKDGRLQPRILTPSQYERTTKQQPVSVPVSLLNGRNFKEILVFDTVLDFRK